MQELEQFSLAQRVIEWDYKNGSKSLALNKDTVDEFHKRVVYEILIGNKVKLPNGMSIEIIKTISEFRTSGSFKTQPEKTNRIRFGFAFEVKFRFHKLTQKKVRFEVEKDLTQKLNKVLEKTDLDFRLVTYVSKPTNIHKRSNP